MCKRRQETGPSRSVPARHKGSRGIQHRVKVNKKIGVVAYSGYKGEETPRSFILEDKEVSVTTVIRAWIEASSRDSGMKRFFFVSGSNGLTYKIYYDEIKSEWFLAGE